MAAVGSGVVLGRLLRHDVCMICKKTRKFFRACGGLLPPAAPAAGKYKWFQSSPPKNVEIELLPLEKGIRLGSEKSTIYRLELYNVKFQS